MGHAEDASRFPNHGTLVFRIAAVPTGRNQHPRAGNYSRAQGWVVKWCVYDPFVGLSLAQRVALLPVDVRDEWLDTLPEEILTEMLNGEWWYVARPEQIPPMGDWLVALALAGRGWGKSRAGAEWLTEKVIQHPYDAHGQPTEWLLIGETLADTRTICLEGPAGMLRVLTRRKIEFRYKQSPRPMILFPDGAKVYAEGADDEDVGRGYNASGAWVDEICVAEGSPVATDRGVVPIEEITTADWVLTLGGFRRVTSARLTDTAADVLVIITDDAAVAVTPNHRVWVDERGWVRADAVQPGDTMLTWLPQMNQSLVTLPPSMTGTGSDGSSTSAWDTTSTETDLSYTEVSGQRSTAPSQKTMRSTTSMVNDGTTGWPTSNVLRHQLITDSLQALERTSPGWKADLNGPVEACEICGRDGSHGKWCAQNVAQRFSVQVCEQSSALSAVPAQFPCGSRKTRVVAVHKGCRPVRVYDLSVEGLPQFYAGGLLVHNCKWPKPYESWYQGILPSLRMDLISDHPRCFATTTPKPIKLLQEWMSRNDGTIHLMGGSTFDNATNLSAHVLRELKLRYAGTDLGEQELYGKMLELMGGGLFKRLDISNNRVQVVPDGIVARVVGMDPNLTGEDAETGLIAMARTRTDDMYVLGDRTVPHSGRAAALAAWRAVDEFDADLLVYEENLGKRYLQEVLQDAYAELVELGVFPRGTTPPMKPVHAKHGKKTRAEPVAMRSEQGRLHIVGEMPELENQMVLFDPESTRESPDRMDAMVHAAIRLMSGERRRGGISDPSKYDFPLDQGLYDLGRLM